MCVPCTIVPYYLDGKVLVTGGIDHSRTFSDSGSELTPEIYDPTTNIWTEVVAMATPRTYHSVVIY